jgi:cell division protein FtsX
MIVISVLLVLLAVLLTGVIVLCRWLNKAESELIMVTLQLTSEQCNNACLISEAVRLEKQIEEGKSRYRNLAAAFGNFSVEFEKVGLPIDL